MELIFVYWLLCAGIGMAIASAKNRSLLEGFFLSFLCGIFGVIIEAVLPKQLPKPPAGLTAVACLALQRGTERPRPYELRVLAVPPESRLPGSTCPHPGKQERDDRVPRLQYVPRDNRPDQAEVQVLEVRRPVADTDTATQHVTGLLPDGVDQTYPKPAAVPFPQSVLPT